MRRNGPLFTAAVIGTIILVSFGFWQVQRLTWKQALIAQLEARQHAPVTGVPAEAEWSALQPDDYEYRHVAAVGTYQTAQSALVFRGGSPNAQGEGPGYHMITPLRLPDGGTILVNRGFVPLAKADEARANVPDGAVSVTGLMRSPESRNTFTPADEPQKGVWYTRDPASIAAQSKLTRVAPFTIDADADPKAKGWPRPGATVVDIPNNHLSYALTWFGLALALVGVTFVYWRNQRRAG